MIAWGGVRKNQPNPPGYVPAVSRHFQKVNASNTAPPARSANRRRRYYTPTQRAIRKRKLFRHSRLLGSIMEAGNNAPAALDCVQLAKSPPAAEMTHVPCRERQ